jgi:ribonuclease-3 family protein
MNIKEINPVVLAYLGDSVYEVKIRKFLIEKNICKVNDLQNESKKYVSAVNQAKFLDILTERGIFIDEEIDIIKRARNTRVNSHPRHTDILTYKHATALEALIGYLYMQNNYDRIAEILKYILEI